VIRAVVADGAASVRGELAAVLEADPEFTVVGEARDGREAVEMVARLRPDLLVMGIQMPVLDGLEATKEIMIEAPTPIIILSSGGSGDVELALSATRAGALMVLPSPAEGGEAFHDQFLRSARAMARVKVVRRWRPRVRAVPARPVRSCDAVVAIAASTGGPAALQRVLGGLPRDFPAPILVVQHIARGFVDGLCAWLAASCDLRVKVARNGEALQPRTVYLPPEDVHLTLDEQLRIALDRREAVDGFRPSASLLFDSVASACGSGTVAVILTGMGRDGVEGLLRVRERGGRVLAQDEATSVVFGMPREAARAGVVDQVLPVDEIAGALRKLVARTER